MINCIKKICIISLAFLTLISCQKEDNYDERTSLEIVKSLSNIDIDSIENTTDAELTAIFNKYGDNLQLDTLEIIESKTVNYNGLTGKSVVIDYEDRSENLDKSLIFILSENNNVDTYLKYNIRWENEIGYVDVTTEDKSFMSAEVSSSYEVINLSFNKIHGDGSYLDCLDGAVSACVNDGECAFICGIIWKYCLGAVATACLGHHYL